MKIIALPEVRDYLRNLILILYEKEYFGFREAARCRQCRESVVDKVSRLEKKVQPDSTMEKEKNKNKFLEGWGLHEKSCIFVVLNFI